MAWNCFLHRKKKKEMKKEKDMKGKNRLAEINSAMIQDLKRKQNTVNFHCNGTNSNSTI